MSSHQASLFEEDSGVFESHDPADGLPATGDRHTPPVPAPESTLAANEDGADRAEPPDEGVMPDEPASADDVPGILREPLVREVLGEGLVRTLTVFWQQWTAFAHVVADYSTRYPEHAQAFDAAFPHAQWVVKTWPGREVYRKHVEELLQRVVNGESLAPGTAAEVFTWLLRTGQDEDLEPAPLAVSVQLLERLLGHHLPVCMEPSIPSVPAAEIDAALSRLREQLTQADRAS